MEKLIVINHGLPLLQKTDIEHGFHSEEILIQHDEINQLKSLLKARTKKYVRRWKGKDGKWNYEYPEEKKGFWNTLKDFFDFKTYTDFTDKVEDDYETQDVKGKYNLSADQWRAHFIEYFTNKKKWDKIFSSKKSKKSVGVTKPQGLKDDDKKTPDKKEHDKKSKWHRGALQLLFKLYSKGVGEKELQNMSDSEQRKAYKEFLSQGNKDTFDGFKKQFYQSLFDPATGKPIEIGNYLQKTTETVEEVKPKPEVKQETIKGDNGSKTKTNTGLTKKQAEEIKNSEERASREGYYNEKPSEVLNVGEDVWGAARHKFDTYEKFTVDISQMEKSGTAQAYVTKKNLLGDYGLANMEERVKAGETEYKVLASYMIRDYLPKMPPNNSESRAKYMEMCRAITRLDENTTTVQDFYLGLAEVYSNVFGKEKGTGNIDIFEPIDIMSFVSKKSKQEIVDIVGFPLKALLEATLFIPDKADYYNMEKSERKQFNNMSEALVAERGKEESLTAKDLKSAIIGATKAAGLKLRKGDSVKLTDKLKNKVYLVTSRFVNDEDKQKYIELSKKLGDIYEKIGYHYPTEEQDKQITEMKKEMYNLKVRDYIYPEETGQIIRAGKDTIDVSFRFPDGKIRSFRLKPHEIDSESIESIKSQNRKKSVKKVDLYLESKVTRKGGKDYSNIDFKKGQEILNKEYGFRALQYGNSMPDNEKNYHTTWSVQAFSDLSDVLNIPIKQISANGKLGLGFGARGKPVPGIKAVAHYEPGSKMINLTRSSGFGSMAHEWGHFMDNILSEKMGTFISNTPTYEKKKVHIDNMKHGSIYIRQKGKKILRYFFDKKASNTKYPFALLKAGQTKPNEDSAYYGFYQKEMEVQEPTEIRIESMARDIAETSLQSLIDQTSKVVELLPKDSMDREDLEEGILKNHYLLQPEEAFARAFEAYIVDKLESVGRENTYLASKAKTTKKAGKYVYPQGETRKKINQLFDEFFKEIKENNSLQKAIDNLMKLLKSRKITFIRN